MQLNLSSFSKSKNILRQLQTTYRTTFFFEPNRQFFCCQHANACSRVYLRKVYKIWALYRVGNRVQTTLFYMQDELKHFQKNHSRNYDYEIEN